MTYEQNFDQEKINLEDPNHFIKEYLLTRNEAGEIIELGEREKALFLYITQNYRMSDEEDPSNGLTVVMEMIASYFDVQSKFTSVMKLPEGLRDMAKTMVMNVLNKEKAQVLLLKKLGISKEKLKDVFFVDLVKDKELKAPMTPEEYAQKILDNLDPKPEKTEDVKHLEEWARHIGNSKQNTSEGETKGWVEAINDSLTTGEPLNLSLEVENVEQMEGILSDLEANGFNLENTTFQVDPSITGPIKMEIETISKIEAQEKMTLQEYRDHWAPFIGDAGGERVSKVSDNPNHEERCLKAEDEERVLREDQAQALMEESRRDSLSNLGLSQYSEEEDANL